jgi:hypothetical protein
MKTAHLLTFVVRMMDKYPLGLALLLLLGLQVLVWYSRYLSDSNKVF